MAFNPWYEDHKNGCGGVGFHFFQPAAGKEDELTKRKQLSMEVGHFTVQRLDKDLHVMDTEYDDRSMSFAVSDMVIIYNNTKEENNIFHNAPGVEAGFIDKKRCIHDIRS